MLNLKNDLMATQPTPRVELLRARYFRDEMTLSIDADRIITRVMKATEGEPMIVRRGKAFCAVVRDLPVEIFPDELFVGWLSGNPWVSYINTEHGNAWTEKTLDSLPMGAEDKKALRDEIIPYWKAQGRWERTRAGRVKQLYTREMADLLWPDGVDPVNRVSSGFGPISEIHTKMHIGHTLPNFEKVLKKGLLGVAAEAEERIARLNLSDPDDLKKKIFLSAAVEALQAAAGIGARFAAEARGQAAGEGDAKRKAELLAMAAICDQVPAHPARTFYEALQSLWFTHLLHWWETPELYSISPGRVDQYLYPYYKQDIQAGRMTDSEAQELIDCFLMRFAQDAASYRATNGLAQHMDLGGLNAEGLDATNELSYMFLEGMMHTRMVEPNMGVLLHSKTPELFLMKACQLCSLGTGHPMFISQDTAVEDLLARGTLGGRTVPLDLARQSSAIGCTEPTVVNKSSGFLTGGYIGMATPLELVLHNGRLPFFKDKQIGLETGDPSSFQSFEEVRSAFRKQLAWLVGKMAGVINLCYLATAEMYPTVYQSTLIDGCIESGRTREEGGAEYNFGPCINTAGAVDVADSLAVIKKLVFDDGVVTLKELAAALWVNFKGYEDLRRKALNVAKFGNDDDFVDQQMAWLMHVFSQEVIKHKNVAGGHMLPLQIPLAGYVGTGKVVGALPSGRLAGEPFSDGISPTRGSDLNGPTAVLKSVGKMNNAEVFLGQTLNMRIAPETFQDRSGFKRMGDLLRTFVDQKILHIQFNIVSSDTLRAAQKDPQSYRDLMVRVAGYVAYYTRLPKALQDGIIARTEHRL